MSKLGLIVFGVYMILILSGHAFGQESWEEVLKSGDLQKVKELIESGANINEKFKNGDTPLVVATNKGHVETVTALLKAGANPQSKNRQGIPAIVLAAMDSAIIKSLLDHSANVDESGPDGFTALMLAAGTGRENVVKQLIKAGADINAQTDDGFTPMNVALCRNRNRIVNLLQREGVKINKEQLLRVKGKLLWDEGFAMKEAKLQIINYSDGKVTVIYKSGLLLNPGGETDNQGRFEVKLPLKVFKSKSSKFIIEANYRGRRYLLRNRDGVLIVHEFPDGEGIIDLGSIVVE